VAKTYMGVTIEIRKVFDKYWILLDLFSNVLGQELFKLWDLINKSDLLQVE